MGTPCPGRVLLPAPVPRKRSALPEARGQVITALPPKGSSHGLWAAAHGSERGSEPLQTPASWPGQSCHLHGAVSELAKHCLCSFFCHMHLPERGLEQWMCIYPLVCLEAKEGRRGSAGLFGASCGWLCRAISLGELNCSRFLETWTPR